MPGTKAAEVDLSTIGDLTETTTLDMIQNLVNGEDTSFENMENLEFEDVKSNTVKKDLHQSSSFVNLFKTDDKDRLTNARGSILMTTNYFGAYNYYLHGDNWRANNDLTVNLNDQTTKTVSDLETKSKKKVKFIFTGEVDNKLKLKKSSRDLEKEIGQKFHCHHYTSVKKNSKYVYVGLLELLKCEDKDVKINNIDIQCRFYYFGN
jgi:hypothetical protein